MKGGRDPRKIRLAVLAGIALIAAVVAYRLLRVGDESSPRAARESARRRALEALRSPERLERVILRRLSGPGSRGYEEAVSSLQEILRNQPLLAAPLIGGETESVSFRDWLLRGGLTRLIPPLVAALRQMPPGQGGSLEFLSLLARRVPDAFASESARRFVAHLAPDSAMDDPYPPRPPAVFLRRALTESAPVFAGLEIPGPDRRLFVLTYLLWTEEPVPAGIAEIIMESTPAEDPLLPLWVLPCLSRSPSTRVPPWIVEHLADFPQGAVEGAMDALRATVGPASLPAIQRAIPDLPAPLRQAIQDLLDRLSVGNLTGTGPAPSTEENWRLRMLREGDKQALADALRYLELHPNEDALHLLENHIDHPDPSIAVLAVRALRAARITGVLPPLIRAIENRRIVVADQAARAVVALTGEEFGMYLGALDLTRFTDPGYARGVREQWERWYESHASERPEDWMARGLLSPEADRARRAAREIEGWIEQGQLTQEWYRGSRGALLGRYPSAPPDIKGALIRIRAHFEGPRGAPDLLKLAPAEADADVRDEILRSASQALGEDSLAHLTALLVGLEAENAASPQVFEFLRARYPPLGIYERLAEYTGSPEEVHRSTCAWYLGDVGIPEALSDLVRLLEDPSARVRYFALRSLQRATGIRDSLGFDPESPGPEAVAEWRKRVTGSR